VYLGSTNIRRRLTEPDALSQVMTATSLFDKLATTVGRPEIALTASRSVELCDRAVAADSNLMAVIQPYRDRFYHRIRLIAAQQNVIIRIINGRRDDTRTLQGCLETVYKFLNFRYT